MNILRAPNYGCHFHFIHNSKINTNNELRYVESRLGKVRSRSLDALGSRIRIWPAPCTTECLYLGRNQSNDLRQAAEGQSVRLGCGRLALVLEVFYRGLVCLKSSGLFFQAHCPDHLLPVPHFLSRPRKLK